MSQLAQSGVSHAYVDGSFVAMCGYVRGAREPMDARKPRCAECSTQDHRRNGESPMSDPNTCDNCGHAWSEGSHRNCLDADERSYTLTTHVVPTIGPEWYRKAAEREEFIGDHGEDHGPFDPDELVQWADLYGHPERWAKKAQALHAENERLKAKALDLHDAAGKAYDALAPFRAVAEAMDTFDGFSDDEWLRLKPRLAGHIDAARVALNERTT